MKARLKDKPQATGFADRFNIHALFEVIMGFDEGDQDSVFGKDVEVFVEAKQSWMPLKEALASHDVITDNYNTTFFEPRTEEDRKRGFTL